MNQIEFLLNINAYTSDIAIIFYNSSQDDDKPSEKHL